MCIGKQKPLTAVSKHINQNEYSWGHSTLSNTVLPSSMSDASSSLELCSSWPRDLRPSARDKDTPADKNRSISLDRVVAPPISCLRSAGSGTARGKGSSLDTLSLSAV